MPKITIAEPELRQALEGIVCPHHYKAAIWHQWRNGHLDFTVEQVLTDAGIDDVAAAIQFLIESRRAVEGDAEFKVTLSDIEQNSVNRDLYKKVDVAMGKVKDPTKKGDPTREFGVRGHVTIPNLFTGAFIKLEKQSERERLQFVQEVLNFEGEINFPLTEKAPEKNTQEKVTLNHIKRIQILWRKIVSRLGTDMFPADSGEYKQLLELLHAVFRDDLDQLLALRKKSKDHEYLAFLSVLTWVTAILRYRDKGTVVLFKEIRLFPHHYDVSLGRIDALEVVSIDGTEPDGKQTKILKTLAGLKYDSIGHLLFTLVQRFGKKLELRIHDWKFAVGDGDNGIGKTHNLVHFHDVQPEPLKKHRNQMERYLSTSMISYGTIAKISGDPLQLWETEDFSISGEIHYFFPDKIWLSHVVNLTNEEKKESFGRIAANYTDGEFRRKILNVSDGWLVMALDLSAGKKEKPKAEKSQLFLEGIRETTDTVNGIHYTGKVSQLIKDSVVRKWLDEFQLVEDDGTPFPKLHLNKLVDAVNNGTISAPPDFDFAKGGLIPCFMPDHGHTGKGTPSFSITNKNGGGFKCFGSCGISGRFATGSIPEYLAGRIQSVSRRLSVKSFKDIDKFHLSERHEEVMNIAQRIFQNQFLTSTGARYLETERKLNPELSMHFGAGYADEKAIDLLLDCDVTYDELLKFGFVRLSHKIKEYTGNNRLVEILKKRGMTVDEIKRDWPKTVDGKAQLVPALPFIVLNNVVTYKLDINNRITSFYGRVADKDCPKQFAHTKTSIEGVPHGGFNITRAMESAILKAAKDGRGEPPRIIITEAAIDADTVQQHGRIKEVGALVGVNNHLLFQILALFPGNIVTALNWDKSEIVDGKEIGMAGQRNTIKFLEFLKSVNFDHNVYDFTEGFVQKVPHFNDFNSYWKEVSDNYWVRKLPGSDKVYLNPFDFDFMKRIL